MFPVLFGIALVLSILITSFRGRPRELSAPKPKEDPTKTPLSIVWTRIAGIWEATTKGFGKGDGGKNEKKSHLITYPIIFLVSYYGIGLYWMKSNTDMYGPWQRDPWLFWVFIPATVLFTAWVATLKRSIPNLFTFLLLTILLNDARIEYVQTNWWKNTHTQLERWDDSQRRKDVQRPHLRNPEERMAQPGDPDCDPQWVTLPVIIGSNEYCRYETEDCVFIRLNGGKWFRYHPDEETPYTDKVKKVEFMSATEKPVRVTITFITKQEAMGK